jgi:hypothetical protein
MSELGFTIEIHQNEYLPDRGRSSPQSRTYRPQVKAPYWSPQSQAPNSRACLLRPASVLRHGLRHWPYLAWRGDGSLRPAS